MSKKFSTYLKNIALAAVTPEWKAVFNQDDFRECLDKCFHELVADLKSKGVHRRHHIQNGIEEYIRPEPKFILNAFAYTPPADTHVIIVGEDPYPQKGTSDGLAFSKSGMITNSSLYNIFRSLERQGLIEEMPETIDSLEAYASQGVLLLNTYLTRTPEIVSVGNNIYIENNGSGKARNQHKFWSEFTGMVVDYLINLHRKNTLCIFAMGNIGKQVIAKYENIEDTPDGENIHIYWWTHPSPTSPINNKVSEPQHFINCPHFTAINNELVMAGKQPINWKVPLTGSKLHMKTHYIFLATDGAYHPGLDIHSNSTAAGAAVFGESFRGNKTSLSGIFRRKLLPCAYKYNLETFTLEADLEQERHLSSQRAELLGAILGLSAVLKYLSTTPKIMDNRVIILMVIDNLTVINYINHGVMGDYSGSTNSDLLDVLYIIIKQINHVYNQNIIEEYRRVDFDPDNRPKYNSQWHGLTVIHQNSHTNGALLTGIHKEMHRLNQLADSEANNAIKNL